MNWWKEKEKNNESGSATHEPMLLGCWTRWTPLRSVSATEFVGTAKYRVAEPDELLSDRFQQAHSFNLSPFPYWIAIYTVAEPDGLLSDRFQQPHSLNWSPFSTWIASRMVAEPDGLLSDRFQQPNLVGLMAVFHLNSQLHGCRTRWTSLRSVSATTFVWFIAIFRPWIS